MCTVAYDANAPDVCDMRPERETEPRKLERPYRLHKLRVKDQTFRVLLRVATLIERRDGSKVL